MRVSGPGRSRGRLLAAARLPSRVCVGTVLADGFTSIGVDSLPSGCQEGSGNDEVTNSMPQGFLQRHRTKRMCVSIERFISRNWLTGLWKQRAEIFMLDPRLGTHGRGDISVQIQVWGQDPFLFQGRGGNPPFFL